MIADYRDGTPWLHDSALVSAAPAANTFSQTAKSTFQVFSDDISLRLGGLQYSGFNTSGDGTAGLAESPDAGHARDQVLEFATTNGLGAAFAAQDIRYHPHDGDRDSFATVSLASLSSWHWRAVLAVEGKAGRFFAGYAEAATQADPEFEIGFTMAGPNWQVTVDGRRRGRAIPQGELVEIHVAGTATTLTVSTRRQGEVEWRISWSGTGLSLAALRSVRWGLWSTAPSATSAWFSEVALAEDFADIDRDFYLAGSGTRDVSQTQANIALVIPDGLFKGTQARLRWAAGSDPTGGTAGSWVALSGKVQSVLPMSLTGLTHNTAYSYQFEIATSDGTILYTSNAYRFRTLANAGTAQAAELAFGSCHVQVPWGHPYVNDEYVTDTAGTAYLGSWHLGDQGYEAGALLPIITDGYPEMDPPESADDFEFQIRDWACDTKLVPLFERGMFFCTPDDHQIINDFDARHKAGGSMANTLANNYTSRQSDNYGAGTKLSDLWTAGIATFNAWFIDHWIDKPSSGVLYKHWTHGKVEIILLDTRTERYQDGNTKYISDTQLAWVKDRIDNIAATTNLVLFVGQGAFSTYTSKASEGWERNADAQYEDFVDYCVANIDPAVNFAFINGDDHVGFNRHFIVKTAANPSMPVNFCGELRASGGSIGEFVTQGGHAEWWLPGTDNPSTNSFFRCSGALLSITADADAVTETMKVGSTIYTDTMLSSTAFTPAGVADLLEWWDASDNATAWSNTAATTPATAGSSNCAALTGKVAGTLLTGPTAPPTYVTDGTNGQKCLSFNSATPQRLSYIGSLVTTAFSGDDTPYTVMFTAKRNAAGVLAVPVSVASSTGSTDPSQRFFISAANEAGSVRSTSGGASSSVNTTGAGIGATWDTYTFCYTGSRLLVMVNDVLHDVLTHGVDAVATLDRLVVGCRYRRDTNTFVNGLNGRMGEIFIIANQALTKDVLNLRDYLMAKWHN